MDLQSKIFSFQTRITILFIHTLFVSCGKIVDNSVDNSPVVFYMNLDEGLSTLDPAYARDQSSGWMVTQLFNTLVSLDDKLQIAPSLAHSWEIGKEGTEYTFHLRQGIQFHKHPSSGMDSAYYLRAEDVVYSFMRICDPQIASSGFWIFNQKIKGLEEYRSGKATTISGLRNPNDSTVVIELVRPFPPFLGLLSMPYGSIVPKKQVEKDPEFFRSHPLGTGPFRFFQWQEGNHLILHKNTEYFEFNGSERLPYLDAIMVQFIPSRLSAFVAFTQGKIDMIHAMDNSFKDEILFPDGRIKPAYAQNYQVMIQPQLNTEYLGILVDKDKHAGHALRDPRVRQALNYAIDKEKMIKYLLNGLGSAADAGFMPEGTPGFDRSTVKGYYYDPEKAKSLLAAAGYPGAARFPQLTLYSTAKYAHIAEFIQKSFENIGIRAQIQSLQGGALRKEIYTSQIQFWRASWIADYPDGENYLALFYSPNFSPGGPNTTHFSNSTFDRLYQQSLTETEDSLRYGLYQEMERLMLREAPIIPLYYDRSFRIIQKNISGMKVNAMNHLNLKMVEKN